MIDPQQAGQVVKTAIAASVDRLLKHEQAIREGSRDPEAVHQARVATRRLRSDLRTFAPLLDPAWSVQLRTELGWLADLLGEVRDREVLQLRLQGDMGMMGINGTAAGALNRRLSSRRAAARRRLLEGIESERHEVLIEHLKTAAESPRLNQAAQSPAAEVLPGLAARAWSKLRKQVVRQGHSPSVRQLHAIRIAAKRSRYAAEAVAPVAGKKAERFAKVAGELQDTLGEFHDASVSRQWLEEQVGGLPPDAAFAAGEISAKELQRANDARRAWPKIWGKLQKPDLHAWMDQWLS